MNLELGNNYDFYKPSNSSFVATSCYSSDYAYKSEYSYYCPFDMQRDIFSDLFTGVSIYEKIASKKREHQARIATFIPDSEAYDKFHIFQQYTLDKNNHETIIEKAFLINQNASDIDKIFREIEFYNKKLNIYDFMQPNYYIKEIRDTNMNLTTRCRMLNANAVHSINYKGYLYKIHNKNVTLERTTVADVLFNILMNHINKDSNINNNPIVYAEINEYFENPENSKSRRAKRNTKRFPKKVEFTLYFKDGKNERYIANIKSDHKKSLSNIVSSYHIMEVIKNRNITKDVFKTVKPKIYNKDKSEKCDCTNCNKCDSCNKNNNKNESLKTNDSEIVFVVKGTNEIKSIELKEFIKACTKNEEQKIDLLDFLQSLLNKN